ncbi:MAG: 50S ribosomal protein L11 methyltransferase [Desulfobulbaceae bacterium]|nr:50S ribosomal protein L11 methyltransferase [Desulfobulbaceae bacterium]
MPNTFDHRSPRSWTKIQVETNPGQAELIASFITSITGLGVEQSIDQPGSSLPVATVTGYLEDKDEIQIKQQEILSFLENLSPKPSQINFEEIIEEDWGKNWKKHYRPTQITDRITIKPTWENHTPKKDEIVIEIDPGLAFGTGLHASTRLALQLTEKAFSLNPPPTTVLDVGTGTGILGMAAAFLGATDVTCIDNDPDAVVCALENVSQNKLSSTVKVSGMDLDDLRGTYDLIIANITADVLTLLAPGLTRLLASPGQLILAGILKGDQAQAIEKTFTALGLGVCDSPQEEAQDGEEWQAFRFVRTT